nr:NERD domain-containing protein [Mucilaginibacter sp. X5P1]
MANSDLPTIEFYIGAPIIYRSEILCIHHFIDLLKKERLTAILIANVNINLRQIDLIIALENKTIVVEIKGSHLPISGTVNGDWQMQLPNGEKKVIGNYYNQTLNAKHIVKDMITTVKGADTGYPESLLLFQPFLPLGSAIPESDFKVAIKNLNNVKSLNEFKATSGFDFTSWNKFIVQQNLQKVKNSEELFNQDLRSIELHLSRYTANYTRNYEHELQQFVDVELAVGSQTLSSNQFNDLLIAPDNLIISGETGCGKSLLAKKIGNDVINQGGIPIYLEAKYFERLLGPMIDIEVGLLEYKSSRELFKDAISSGRLIYLIIDGYNECDTDLRGQLVRCLLALLRRYLVKIIIVGQERYEELSPLRGQSIMVNKPSDEIKQKIAGQFCDQDTLNALLPLLQSVSSGIEANVIGNLSKFDISEKSRFSRFDLFIRSRLNGSNKSIEILNELAHFLAQKLAFSLSAREADILLSENNLHGNDFEKVVKSGVIKVYGNNVSFAHEEFLNTYIADNIVRKSNNEVNKIISSLSEPKNKKRDFMIIGAIEDLTILHEVLEWTIDYKIIVSCIKKDCGSFAFHWATNKMETLLISISTEIEGIIFQVTGDSMFNIITDPQSLLSWTNQQMAFVIAAKILLQDGYYFEEAIGLINKMDLKIMQATTDLAETIKQRKQSIFSDLFSCVYMSFGRKEIPALTTIVSDIHSSLPFNQIRNHEQIFEYIKSYLSENQTVGYGAFYFIMAFVRYKPHAHILFPYLLDYTAEKSTILPYHFRLEIFDRLPHCWQTEQERLALIDNLNLLSSSNPFTNSSIFEALQALGATEKDELEYQSQAIEEVKRVLNEPDNPQEWTIAYGIYFNQIDHPYGSAYSYAINTLTEEDSKLFYLLALRGANKDMFMPSLICRTENYNFDEYGAILKKWTIIPEKLGTAPQEDVNLLYLSHIMLGRIKSDLISRLNTYSNPWQKTLCATSELLYWVNRPDLEKQELEIKGKDVISYLLDGFSEYSFDAIYQVMHTINYLQFEGKTFIPIERKLPELMLTLARKAIKFASRQKSIYNWHKPNEVVSHAIYKLGTIGNLTDVLLLKNLINDSELGTDAVAAIITLQG